MQVCTCVCIYVGGGWRRGLIDDIYVPCPLKGILQFSDQPCSSSQIASWGMGAIPWPLRLTTHIASMTLLIWARQKEAEEGEKIWDMALPSPLTCCVTPAKLSILSREASMSDSVISKGPFHSYLWWGWTNA